MYRCKSLVKLLTWQKDGANTNGFVYVMWQIHLLGNTSMRSGQVLPMMFVTLGWVDT
jgi:hypothetical protein